LAGSLEPIKEARNKTRCVLATGEFVTLLSDANLTSCQASGQKQPFVTAMAATVAADEEPMEGGRGFSLHKSVEEIDNY
jgi:hypothetical protein